MTLQFSLCKSYEYFCSSGFLIRQKMQSTGWDNSNEIICNRLVQKRSITHSTHGVGQVAIRPP